MKTGFIILIIVAAIVLGGVIFLGSDSEYTGNLTADSAEGVREFNLIAKNWEFDPETIIVKEGETVIIYIESVDVEHGFSIPEFGVSKNLKPGKKETIQFVADEKGTYSFFCNVYCGAGHRGMTGTLIVE